MKRRQPTDNDRLRQARLCKGWKQEQLAEKLGIAFETVSRWERGEMFPSPLYREELCRLFGATREELGLQQEAVEDLASLAASTEMDRAFVRQFQADLDQQGIAVWSLLEIKQLDAVQKRAALREAIRSAELVVVMVSPATRSSRDVRTALDQASLYKRAVCTLWVKGENWQACLPQNQQHLIATLDARSISQEETLKQLIGIYQQLQQTSQKAASLSSVNSTHPQALGEPRNPYKGLKAFRSDEQRDFFGRDQVTADLSSRLASMIAPAHQQDSLRLLTILGPSGSGKSSVVAAGLLPHLKGGGLPGSEQWIYLEPLVPGAHPLESLARILAPHFPSRSIRDLHTDLEEDSRGGLVPLLSSLTSSYQAKIVLFIDQGEELFTLTTDNTERQLFIELVVTAATDLDSPLIVLLTLRADFVERALMFPELGHVIQKTSYLLLPMGSDDLRKAIEEPARLPDVQLTFEGNLVGDLLYEVQGQPGALPLLSFTLDQLFLQRENYFLTISAYQKMGGVKGALVQRAESTYLALPSEEHRHLARTLFLRLISPGMTEQDTVRRRAALRELLLPEKKQTAILQEVVEAFTTARLLTTNEIMGVPTIEVSHEALIREWTRLVVWLKEAREDISVQQRLSQTAEEWESRKRPKDHLYRGTQLQEARAWARHNTPSEQEAVFLRASLAQRLQSTASLLLLLLLVVSSVGLTGWFFLNQQQISTLVTNLSDNGIGSLRWCIDTAKPGSTITFAVTGTIELTSAHLTINKNLTIRGPNQRTITLSSGERRFGIRISPSFSVEISHLSFRNNYFNKGRQFPVENVGFIENQGMLVLNESNFSENWLPEFGSGLLVNDGVLTINRSTFSNNSGVSGISASVGTLIINMKTLTVNTTTFSTGPNCFCDAIFNAGSLLVNMSTFSGRRDDYNGNFLGGGIYTYYGGAATISNSTFFNIGTGSGTIAAQEIFGASEQSYDVKGALSFFDSNNSGIATPIVSETSLISFCTIYIDSSEPPNRGIFVSENYRGQVIIRNNIIVTSDASSKQVISGEVVSKGYNLIENFPGVSFIGSQDLHATDKERKSFGDLQIASTLGDNGGPVQTLALSKGSPAVDAIPVDVCLSPDQIKYEDIQGLVYTGPLPSSTDQRGVKRPQGSQCDIGAYEYQEESFSHPI